MRKLDNYNPNTSDHQDEQLTEVTKDDKVIGPVSRKECHNETRKPWHRSIHIYLFNRSGDLCFSQRSLKKDTAAGEWTVSAGGHVKFGDSYEKTARKEAIEELGLDTKLEMLDKLVIDYGTEREVISIYAGVDDKKPEYNPEEIQQLKFFKFEEIVNNFKEARFDLSGGSRDSFKHVIKTGSLRQFRKRMLKK